MEYCPAALQLAFVRASSRPEPSSLALEHGLLRDQRRRRDGSDARSTWGNIRKFFQVQPKERTTRGTLTGSLGSARTPPQGYEYADCSQPTARSATSGSGLDGPIPPLLSDEPTRDPSGADESYSILEERDGTEQSQEAAPGGLILIGMPDGARQDVDYGPTVPIQSGMGSSHQEPAHHLRGQIYLQWCGEAKCPKQTNKPAIDVVKMQKLLEDQVEAAQEDHHILRFKSLKNTSTEIKRQQICPFLLHLSIRESSIWKENPLATSLAKYSKQQDVKMSNGRSSKRK